MAKFRLAKVASELNKSTVVIAEYLRNKGYEEVQTRPTFILSESMYNDVRNAFSEKHKLSKEPLKRSNEPINIESENEIPFSEVDNEKLITEEIQFLREKTRIVVFTIEQALKRFIDTKQNDSKTKEIITKLKQSQIKRGNSIYDILDTEKSDAFLEEAYLNEIFEFALHSTKGSFTHEGLLFFKNLCEILDLYSIRNAAAHDKKFYSHMWYSISAIATHPIVHILNLKEIIHSFHKAEKGDLSLKPPQNWFTDTFGNIKNTLPKSFDHDDIKLIGRNDSIKELLRIISKPKNQLIAVVGSGGIGKTAFVLETLKQLSKGGNNDIDGIIYFSLKTHKLTIEGTQEIHNIDNYESYLKEELIDHFQDLYPDLEGTTFKEILKEKQDENLIICIDNLESLLIKNEGIFLNFYEDFPINWKILITSRINTNQARLFPLEPLDPKHSKIVIRKYNSIKNINLKIDEDTVEKIASKTHNIPLALKLTVDYLAKQPGASLDQILTQTNQNIAEYSYHNLIESLGEGALDIIAYLNESGDSADRTDICGLLELDEESYLSAVKELLSTSLLTYNKDSDDLLQLNESIKPYLYLNYRNKDARERINKKKQLRNKILKKGELQSSEKAFNIFNPDYIPKDAHDEIKEEIYVLNQHLKIEKNNVSRRNMEFVSNRKNNLIRFLEIEKDQNIRNWIHWSLYRCFEYFKDIPNQKKHLEKIAKIDVTDIHPYGILQFGELLSNHESDHEKALTYYKYLIDKKYTEPTESSIEFSFSLNFLYLLTLVQLERFDDVIQWTDSCEHPSLLSLFANWRATAFKRQLEKYHQISKSEFRTQINSAITNILDLFNDLTIQKINKPKDENKRIVEYTFFIVSNFMDVISAKNFKTLTEFIGVSFYEIFAITLKENKTENWYLRNSRYQPTWKSCRYMYDWLSKVEREGNYLAEMNSKQAWWVKSHEKNVLDKALCEEKDLIHAIITNDKNPNYLFAEDEFKQSYFLHISNYIGGITEFQLLQVGDHIALGEIEHNSGQQPSALEIYKSLK